MKEDAVQAAQLGLDFRIQRESINEPEIVSKWRQKVDQIGPDRFSSNRLKRNFYFNWPIDQQLTRSSANENGAKCCVI